MNQCLIFEKTLVLVFHLHKDDFIYGSKSAAGPHNMGSFDGEESWTISEKFVAMLYQGS